MDGYKLKGRTIGLSPSLVPTTTLRRRIRALHGKWKLPSMCSVKATGICCCLGAVGLTLYMHTWQPCGIAPCRCVPRRDLGISGPVSGRNNPKGYWILLAGLGGAKDFSLGEVILLHWPFLVCRSGVCHWGWCKLHLNVCMLGVCCWASYACVQKDTRSCPLYNQFDA